MLTHPLWVKPIPARHWQPLCPWNKLWLPIVELNNPLLHRLLPLGAHGLIENFGVDQSHFWRGMRHPLLDHDQTHPVVNELNCFGMTKGVQFVKYPFPCTPRQGGK